MDETNPMDKTNSMDETSLMDGTNSTGETNLMDETNPVARNEPGEGYNAPPPVEPRFVQCNFHKEIQILGVTGRIGLQESAKGCDITPNVQNSFSQCTFNVGDQRKALLKWLSPLEPGRRHWAMSIDRVVGVGDWLLSANQFIRWREGDHGSAKPVLFCYGNPGVGKTYLSSLVVDTLCDNYRAVACVYCEFHARIEQSTAGLLGALLKQVVSSLEEIPAQVEMGFENSKRRVGGSRLSLPDILKMLVEYLPVSRAFICIDALDEFPTKHRPELWQSLQQILRECPDTRLFLTGRVHICDEVQEYFPGTVESLPISPRERDIGLYLRMRLSRDPEPDAMDEELEADILRIVPEVTSGTFLLASLGMDAILTEVTIHQRTKALGLVGNGLGFQDAYNTTLNRIRQQDGNKAKLGMDALMWLCHCEQPLQLEELRHALGVEPGAEDFNIKNVPSIRTILGCTLGLVTIDKNRSKVRLLHSTLQKYLGQQSAPHSTMAEICLTYLNYRSIRTLPPTPNNALRTTPFLEYAACFWGAHAAREMTEPVKSLAIAILEAKRWNVNRCDSRGETPLIWAVRYGNDRMVELLLEQVEIRLNAVIRDGRTVLSFAAESGNEGAAKLLLEHKDVNPDSSDINGRTPLSFAAEGGHEGVVKLLLEREDVNPNSSDNHDQTPLSYATSMGRDDVVKLLLEARTSKRQSLENANRMLATLILSISLFFAFLFYYGYGDSRGLFHTIHSAWKWLID